MVHSCSSVVKFKEQSRALFTVANLNDKLTLKTAERWNKLILKAYLQVNLVRNNIVLRNDY